jgi:putative phosphoribosyl transferase
MRFQDREHAGRLLAAKLEGLREARPIVLGLTRGGIPVAYEVARHLDAPLDLVVVRKLRAETTPDLPIGAIAEGGATYFVPADRRDPRLTPEQVSALVDEAIADVARRIRLYRGVVAAPRLAGRDVVIVDDFVATGNTVLAAARAARNRGAARVVLAVPVLFAPVEPLLREEFDEVVALHVVAGPEPLTSVYDRLEAITDEGAVAYLRRAAELGRHEELAHAPA